MGARVIELLVNNPGTSYFFAFGAGHFVGENTVLDVVRNAGWKRGSGNVLPFYIL
jgi:hypothetical protein